MDYYPNKLSLNRVSSAVFNKSTFIEKDERWDVPGPGKYNNGAHTVHLKHRGLKFNQALRNLNKTVSVNFPYTRNSEANPGPGYYSLNQNLVRPGTPTNCFNKAEINRSMFLEAGERTPGPAAYNGAKNRYNSICYTFYKDPNHDPIGRPHIGPGTYETNSAQNSKLRASKSAFISNNGVLKERMSLVLNDNPAPGAYKN